MDIKKLIFIIITFIVVFSILSSVVYADVSESLKKATNSVKRELKSIVEDVVIVIANVLLVFSLIIAIVKTVFAYKNHGDVELGWILIIIIGIILVNTFTTWGWELME
jgi:succinate dehydrogenase/fumarate reductase cytochrome b subunit